MAYPNLRQKKGAFFRHLMHFEEPLKDGSKWLDGYAHFLPDDEEKLRRKNNIIESQEVTLAEKMKYVLERHVTKKPKEFCDGGLDRFGNPKPKYPIKSFEVYLTNRPFEGKDILLCILVKNSKGNFVPFSELGGYINASNEVAVYREWILEWFCPQAYNSKRSWCIGDTSVARMRELAGVFLPPTREEFEANMQCLMQGVFEQVYAHPKGVTGAKWDLATEAKTQMHSYWHERGEEEQPEAYKIELASLAFLNLFHKHICKGI